MRLPEPNFFSDHISELLVLIAFVAFATLAVCWKWPSPQLVRLIIGHGQDRFVVWLRLGAFSIVSALLLAFVSNFVLAPLEAAGASFKARAAASVLLTPPLTIFWVTSQAVGAMLQPRSLFVRGGFSIVRGVMWRIIEHEKGAMPATIIGAVAVEILRPARVPGAGDD